MLSVSVSYWSPRAGAIGYVSWLKPSGTRLYPSKRWVAYPAGTACRNHILTGGTAEGELGSRTLFGEQSTYEKVLDVILEQVSIVRNGHGAGRCRHHYFLVNNTRANLLNCGRKAPSRTAC